MHKSINTLTKSDKIVALGASRCQLIRPKFARLSFFTILGAAWSILGVISGVAGRQGAPKIIRFRIETRLNIEK